MDDNEKESVEQLLKLARMAIIAMLVIGGYMGRDTLIGVV